jgi:hydroxymethylbilane synthase
MKDIPAKRPDGLVTSAILKRDSPSDFIAHTVPLDSVSVIGTSSTRRKAQLLRHDPSLEIRPLRGNVDTRLRKLDEGQFDAIILAEAGMQRMGLKISGERLPPHIFVPAPNQGTIAVVSRDDPALNETFSLLDHEQTRNDVMAERAVMEEVGGGCFTPQGIYCSGGYLIAEVLSLDGTRCVRVEDDIKTPDDARRCGMKLHNDAKELIDEAYRALGIDDER